MENGIDLDIIHARLLKMGKTIHEICETNNIPYYMLGGTMLGAIRHKGFIPWDDDMDFGIMRQDMERFILACEKNLSFPYCLETPDKHPYSLSESCKIIDTQTIVREQGISITFHLFIDIFPLDYSTNIWGYFSRNKWIVRTGRWGMYHKDKQLFHKKGLRVIPMKIIPACIWKKIHRALISTKGDYISNYSGHWEERETVPVSCMEEPRLYNFEDFHFYGPSDPHTYLMCLYGDYMQLPSEDKRSTHIISFEIR